MAIHDPRLPTSYNWFEMRRRFNVVLRKRAQERGITVQELMGLHIPLDQLVSVEEILEQGDF